jgi:hypothetical protein
MSESVEQRGFSQMGSALTTLKAPADSVSLHVSYMTYRKEDVSFFMQKRG